MTKQERASNILQLMQSEYWPGLEQEMKYEMAKFQKELIEQPIHDLHEMGRRRGIYAFCKYIATGELKDTMKKRLVKPKNSEGVS